MKKFIIAMGMWAGLAGCKNNTTDSDHCSDTPYGKYTYHYKESSGDCGAIPDYTTTLSGDPFQVGSMHSGSVNCVTGTPIVATDRCSGSMTTTCNIMKNNVSVGNMNMKTSIVMNKNGDIGYGILDVSVYSYTRDNAPICHSLYNIDVSKN